MSSVNALHERLVPKTSVTMNDINYANRNHFVPQGNRARAYMWGWKCYAIVLSSSAGRLDKCMFLVRRATVAWCSPATSKELYPKNSKPYCDAMFALITASYVFATKATKMSLLNRNYWLRRISSTKEDDNL